MWPPCRRPWTERCGKGSCDFITHYLLEYDRILDGTWRVPSEYALRIACFKTEGVLQMLTTYRNVVGLAVLASCSVACRSDVSMDDAAVEDALGGGGGTLTIDGTKVMVTDGTGIAGQPKFALNVVASDGTKLAFAADQCAGSVRSEAVQTRLAITCGNKSGVFVSLLQQWATSDGNKVGLALLVAVPRKDTLARNLANSLLPSGEISLESSSSDQLILYSSATQWPSKDPHATLQSYNKTLAGLIDRKSVV